MLSECAVRLDLPLVKQDALYDCGLASISALCQYWGVEIPPEESAALHARFDPSLAGLRAGRVSGPTELTAHEHAALAAAQHHSPALAAMRGGFELSDNEFKWLVIGGVVVLILVLI